MSLALVASSLPSSVDSVAAESAAAAASVLVASLSSHVAEVEWMRRCDEKARAGVLEAGAAALMDQRAFVAMRSEAMGCSQKGTKEQGKEGDERMKCTNE